MLNKYGFLVLGVCAGFALAMTWNSIKSTDQEDGSTKLEKHLSAVSLTNKNTNTNPAANTVVSPSEQEIAAMCAKFTTNNEARDREINSAPIEPGVKNLTMLNDQRKEYQHRQQEVIRLETMNSYLPPSESYNPPLSGEQAASIEQQRISDTLSEGEKAIHNNPLQDPAVQKEEQMKFQ